jgi:chaperonin GroEL
MEFNNPSQIVKDLAFGNEASDKIMEGASKLANAVKSTLGASGKCVIYEDSLGRPVITKDGVTVAESVVLLDPVENIGATLIKEAASNTVKEAGDGTTTATVLAYSLLKEARKEIDNSGNIRNIKYGIESAANKVADYLDKISIPIEGDKLVDVATISCNNDAILGEKIGQAYAKVGKDGVVFMEESETNETYVEFVEGAQIDSGLKSPYFITDRDKETAILSNPYVLIVSSPINSIRKIQNVLEFIQNKQRSLLIISEVEQQPFNVLLANKVKGNIKVNIVDAPGFGPTRRDFIDDLAFLTGATVIDEQLGDDLDLIDPSVLGEAIRSVTDASSTILQTNVDSAERAARIDEVVKKIKEETNGFLKKKLDQRLAMLSGMVGIVKVGADSKIELKEKKDRVEDAIYAVKAALKEGIVPGGGVALLNAAKNILPESNGERILLEAIKSPFKTILDNAALSIDNDQVLEDGEGINVVTGKVSNMVNVGIIDPVLVTKSALKNAVSVVTTLISADCIISNKRA